MKNFELIRPETLAEAFSVLKAKKEEKTFILAGGTDLLPVMRAGVLDVDYLVDITGLGFNEISETADGITIGALCTFKQIYKNPLVQKNFPDLCKAAAWVGAVQTRGIATMAGNLCAAVPSLDSAPTLLIHEARFKLVSENGERWVDSADFFVAPRRTKIVPKEDIMTEIFVPKNPANYASDFIKFGRRNALSLSIVNAAYGCVFANGTIEKPRAVVGACAATPRRMYDAEKYLEGKTKATLDYDKLDELVKGGISPISDIRASAEYRKQLAAALVRKQVRAIVEG
jgi:CO/xanthine dehydrogenase FAD-binding subunit